MAASASGLALFGSAGNLFLYAFKYPKFRACLLRRKHAESTVAVAGENGLKMKVLNKPN